MGGCGTFKRWYFLARGSQSLRTGHEVFVAWPYSLSALCFLFCQIKHVVFLGFQLHTSAAFQQLAAMPSLCNGLYLETVNQNKPFLLWTASHQFTATRKATNAAGDWQSPAVAMGDLTEEPSPIQQAR